MAQKPAVFDPYLAELGIPETAIDALMRAVGRVIKQNREQLESRIAELEFKLARLEQINKLYAAQNNRKSFNRGEPPLMIGFGDD